MFGDLFGEKNRNFVDVRISLSESWENEICKRPVLKLMALGKVAWKCCE